jgi:hypothetical protein
MLFAFARNNKTMIFGGRKEVYRKKNVCLTAVIDHLVLSLIQNLDDELIRAYVFYTS